MPWEWPSTAAGQACTRALQRAEDRAAAGQRAGLPAGVLNPEASTGPRLSGGTVQAQAPGAPSAEAQDAQLQGPAGPADGALAEQGPGTQHRLIVVPKRRLLAALARRLRADLAQCALADRLAEGLHSRWGGAPVPPGLLPTAQRPSRLVLHSLPHLLCSLAGLQQAALPQQL